MRSRAAGRAQRARSISTRLFTHIENACSIYGNGYIRRTVPTAFVFLLAALFLCEMALLKW